MYKQHRDSIGDTFFFKELVVKNCNSTATSEWNNDATETTIYIATLKCSQEWSVKPHRGRQRKIWIDDIFLSLGLDKCE